MSSPKFRSRRAFAATALAAALSLAPLSAMAQTPTAAAAEPAFGIANATQPEPGMLSAGQPKPEQIRELAQAGYKTVIDLRPPEEPRGFAEPQAVEAAGLAYVNLPVTLQTLDGATLDRFLATMRTAERPVVVHCASANRVGGLYYAWLVLEKGMPAAAALEKAKGAGLRQPELIERVKALVAARQAGE
jgi:uncharacterized protein (TIGR01244 family)